MQASIRNIYHPHGGHTHVQQKLYKVLEFEFHLDLKEDSSNNVCRKIMENEDTN